ncbi:HdaA/DnaA family protein [Pseudopelagicola sp. nBUS_19]|uniref:HdaA/DnaA family protein n=1 Tax=Pseudopelagicola sp. nBUS_19 TaxID=3395316 RepID=UPI003EBA09BF
MAKQLNFDLPVRAALGRGDFFVSPANKIALGLIESWSTWPGNKLVLSGPPGAGKTHLAHVWAGIVGAQIISAASLSGADIPALCTGPIAVEDIPEISQDKRAQTALFHVHNLTLAEGHSMLLTGINDPKHWGLSLPDLHSRMQGTTVATLSQPDDTLLMAVLTKQFNDRQLTPSADTIRYLLTHMDRSFDAATRIVAELDHLSLTEKRPITRTLAKRALN